jgi:hypothetical protein
MEPVILNQFQEGFARIESLWKKCFDDCDEDSSEKTDEGIKHSQVQQTDQYEESIGLDAGEKIAGLFRSETHQDF